METLGVLFPDVPNAVLGDALARYSGNVDAAASFVLDWKEKQPIVIDDLLPTPSSDPSPASSSQPGVKSGPLFIDLTYDQDPSSSTPVLSFTANSHDNNSYGSNRHNNDINYNHLVLLNAITNRTPISSGSSSSGIQSRPSVEDTMAEQERQWQREEDARQAKHQESERLKENFIAMVQAEFPGISTKFVAKLMEQKRRETQSEEIIMDLCVEAIFKLNGKYPMAKRKAEDEDDDDGSGSKEEGGGGGNSEDEESSDEESDLEEMLMKSQEVNQPERNLNDTSIKMSAEYDNNSAAQIFRDFPHLASKPIRDALIKHNYHYVPTYYYLDNLWTETQSLSVTKQRGLLLKNPRKKAKLTVKKDAVFRRERRWLKEKLAKELAEIDKAEREAANFREYKARGELMTCGCCFDDEIPANRVTACGEGHVFCLECGRRAAENEIGLGRIVLKCMTPDCTSVFGDAEAKRFLPKTVYDRLMRTRQQKELEKAGIESLVGCPFCSFAAIIEDEDDKEFRCLAPKCRAVSCRLCRAITHIPLTCQEYAKQREQDSVLAAQHRAEEEMSRALIRECTKCKTPFFKEEGCNKMTCPTCQTVTCYLCKKEIRNGYAHFDPTPANSAPAKPNLCRLWEDTKARHEREVREAKEKALDQLQHENPTVVDKVQLDVPEPPARKRNRRHH